jgi:hypothetical protein
MLILDIKKERKLVDNLNIGASHLNILPICQRYEEIDPCSAIFVGKFGYSSESGVKEGT